MNLISLLKSSIETVVLPKYQMIKYIYVKKAGIAYNDPAYSIEIKVKPGFDIFSDSNRLVIDIDLIYKMLGGRTEDLMFDFSR